jgi:hypothetical protein
MRRTTKPDSTQWLLYIAPNIATTKGHFLPHYLSRDITINHEIGPHFTHYDVTPISSERRLSALIPLQHAPQSIADHFRRLIHCGSIGQKSRLERISGQACSEAFGLLKILCSIMTRPRGVGALGAPYISWSLC